MAEPPSALLDAAAAACKRLASSGWSDLLAAHGLDLGAGDLHDELLRPLPEIDREIAGFEDFATEGVRGIEPHRPAHSLLFHAFASPNVVTGADGQPLGDFPTLAEIAAVENLVFGIQTPSLLEVGARFPGTLMAVTVFASEYRPAPETVHRRHADTCLSRTGVARIGTAPPHYDAAARGFLPFDDGDDHAIRVLPARYDAYLAVQLGGRFDLFGPMNFDSARTFDQSAASDETRSFWVPVHKLFSGSECLRGLDLEVGLQARHVNEKLRRVHRELQRQGEDTGWSEPDIDAPPFVFTEGIAELDPELGPGVLAPLPHTLVAEALRDGEPVDFVVPADPQGGFSPSLTIRANGPFRHAPEYVHVRHAVSEDGSVEDLNDDPDAVERVNAGGYRARHYVDYSGDGSIVASCPQVAVQVPRNVPAYSVVTAPDFYPNCDQRELVEWWTQRVPTALRNRVWQTPPLTLSDERIAPNLQLPDVDFRAEDVTVTAIVSLPLVVVPQQRPLDVGGTRRHAHLPDSAAGIFAPGWDTSHDVLGEVAHLAAYGLGSPFPEDAKLCAALSSFWPAVAPDAGRSFSQIFPTATPLTDEEIGSVGDLPWDGVAGPRRIDGGDVVEYAAFEYVDYVRSALDTRFTLALTGKVDVLEYEARVLVAARSYIALGVDPGSSEWSVVSFRAVGESQAAELAEAESASGVTLGGSRYRVEFGKRGEQAPDPQDHRKVRVTLTETATIFAGAESRLLVRRGGGAWRAVQTA
jgi:hypothetical protein